ncbi:peptidase inhibitor family I36 protein [Frankia sp. AiPs1]|uniref:peptidase inhibitor family I36 protein n=1 Tax=Frankia sp. AiPs1 TaxID=573493 RepID=UPI0020440A88|nr:peptidase inhibitor family I36 protein [Frankia sp. AiPs1]MCM3922513.1 peptidase inhibitor family I36 protein [Frankia sp. AiPs1]
MKKTNLRRGLAVAVGAVAAAGIIAAGQPASAATGGGGATSGSTSAPAAPAGGIAAAGITTKATRNGGGVSAAHVDGLCNLYSNGDGDLCLWYLSNFGGSHADFFFADSNLNDNRFNSPGAGQGAIVGNNSESAWNYDRHLTARVYNGVNYTGPSGTISPSSGGNFTPTFANNVESFQWT